jgi:tRNA(Ile)-lysidine synthase
MPHVLPSPHSIERFRADLAALQPAKGPLGIAFSGGPDSLALLLLAHAAYPGEVRAATVDHQLRSGSAHEAALAATVCNSLSVPHTILAVEIAAGASVQAKAREARYLALAAWMAENGIPTLLTAHHLDDQAETLMMRLLRGSGIAGLAGIRARRPLGATGDLQILRPLLEWRRAELAEIAAASGFEAVADPSNVDEAFDRVWTRRLLAETPALDPLPLARSAAALAEAEDALEAAAAYWFSACVEDRGGILLVRPVDLPAELRRRLFLRCLRHYAPEAQPRGEQVSDALRMLVSGGKGTLGGAKFSGADGTWRIEAAPPRRLARNETCP